MSLFENVARMAKGAPQVDRTKLDMIAQGLGVARRKIFSAPITEEGWHVAMIRHMEVAKSLGVTMFEIDTAQGEGKRVKQTVESMYSVLYRTPGDEWKEKDPETVQTTIVTLYALVIE